MISGDQAILPTNWVESSVGELFNVVGGGTPSTKEQAFWRGDIAWISSADIDEKHHIVPRRRITEAAIGASATNLIPPGSVIVVTRVGLGKVGLATERMCFSQDSQGLVFNSEHLDPSYVIHHMGQAVSVFKHMGRGTTISGVVKKQLVNLPFRLPPGREQRRIVAEIEKQFTRLEAAVEALKRVQANLKRYRASVLKAACEGRLVPSEAELARAEGRDYEPAEKLLARILKERRARWEVDQLAKMHASGKPPKDDQWKAKYKEPRPPDSANLPILPEGWEWARWEHVGFSQNGRSFPSKEYQASGVKLLRPGNLHIRGLVEWTEENTRFLPKRWEVEFPGFIIGARELVMNLTAQSLKDEFLGRVCMTSNSDDCLLNQRIARLTPIHVLPEYLLWMFKSELFRRFVNGLNTGSLIQHMFTSQLAEFCLPLPPLGEQHRIVAEVERRLSVVDELEAVVEANLKRAERLRQAILKRAFEGKLVPQDPSDEPASVLLERIKAAKSSGSAATPGCGTQPTTGKSACATGGTATPGCAGKKLNGKKAQARVPESPARD
ncbi:MAG: restriction endonuclease subunit S [Terriglobia bacterium]